MSIIAVGGIPPKTSLKEVVKAVARPIHGVFEALNFSQYKGFKICYLRLADNLNPKQAVERINNTQTMKKGAKLHAFIPDQIPDLLLSIKPKKLPERLRRTLKIAPSVSRQQLINISYEQIMKEMQAKYTGLYSLSAKNKNILLRNIGQEVYDRILAILDTNANIETCFLLTKMYRKRHPHFGDFQFILSTLHQIQDKQGKPRQQIQEKDLIKVDPKPYTIDNIPYDKIESLLTKYTEKINQKIAAHIEKLKENTQPENDSIEEAARMKVREQLINMEPYLPNITREVIRKNFMPTTRGTLSVKIYGEPYLPNKEVMAPFVSRYRGAGVVRSDHMYNLVVVARLAGDHHRALLAADGTVLGGAKLVIRPANTMCYKQHPSLFQKKKPEPQIQTNRTPVNVDMDWTEQW